MADEQVVTIGMGLPPDLAVGERDLEAPRLNFAKRGDLARDLVSLPIFGARIPDPTRPEPRA